MNEIFENQVEFQQLLYGVDEITPDVVKMYNSATAAVVEIGELLQSDTRWKKTITKSPKPAHYDKDEFGEEFADVFLYLMNIAIFSGLSYDDVIDVITKKQQKNFMRLSK